jgi:hypothetical protein
VIKPQPGLLTSIDYVRHIVDGLREHGVPEEYVAEVKEIASANNPAIAAQVNQL